MILRSAIIILLLCASRTYGAMGTCSSTDLFNELSSGAIASEYAAAYGLPDAPKPITKDSTGNDGEVLKVLNAPHSGGAYQLNKGVVATQLLLREMVVSDLKNLLKEDASTTPATPPKFPILSMYMAQSAIDTSATNIQGVFLDLFPAGSTSRANLLAFFKRQGSPMEAKCGVGTIATDSDVSCAIRGACS